MNHPHSELLREVPNSGGLFLLQYIHLSVRKLLVQSYYKKVKCGKI